MCHRKSCFLEPKYPNFPKFGNKQKANAQIIMLGLLCFAGDFFTLRCWFQAYRAQGYKIRILVLCGRTISIFKAEGNSVATTGKMALGGSSLCKLK